jgi:hypothetical protein
VVAIILIITSIAIPNLMRARMAANDSSAAASEHTIVVGEVSYLGMIRPSGTARWLSWGERLRLAFRCPPRAALSTTTSLPMAAATAIAAADSL